MVVVPLITLLCVATALAIFAGAFYLARYTVRLEHRNTALEDEINRATDHIKQQEEYILTLQQEIEHMKMTVQTRTERMDAPRSWQPGNPLSSGERM